MLLSDGGSISWDAGTGVLTWASTMRVTLPGVGAFPIAAGSQTGVTTAGFSIYVDVSRSVAGAVTTGVLAITDAGHLSDARVILATRGVDSKLYFRNGTVFSDGDTKEFGTLNSKTDRAESIANGLALQAVGFTYTVGTNQLVVYVGGILQKKGLHYNETSGTQVTFLSPYIPVSGELITYLNVIGGEGPAGSPSLQQAWAAGNQVDVTAGTPVELTSSTGAGTTTVFRAGHASSIGGLDAIKMERSGRLTVDQIYIRDSITGTYTGVVEADASGNLRLRSLTGAAEYGIQVNKNGSGVEFGRFPNPAASGTTGGAVAIATATGTTSAIAETVVATGLTTIKAVIASVYHAGLGFFVTSSYAGVFSVGRQFFVTFDAAGDVTISSVSDGTGVLTADMQGQTYNLVIFY